MQFNLKYVILYYYNLCNVLLREVHLLEKIGKTLVKYC